MWSALETASVEGLKQWFSDTLINVSYGLVPDFRGKLA
jgi:hypothetical protein